MVFDRYEIRIQAFGDVFYGKCVISRSSSPQNYLKGYALCRRPPLSGRVLRGGGYVALAHLPCWVYWLLLVLIVLVFLWNVWKQVGFLSLAFIVFPATAVTLDTNFGILGVQNLSFGGLLPPFYHPGAHFVSLGTPWGTMGAGRTRGGPKRDF